MRRSHSIARHGRAAIAVAALAAAAAVVAVLTAWQPKRGFVRCTFVNEGGENSAFRLFVPHDYESAKPRPLVVYLHGAGQTGTDGERQLQGGLAEFVRRVEYSFPCLALFPQAAGKSWDARSKDGQRALAVLDAVQATYAVDPDRIYLTGHSMGGHGVWSLAHSDPQRWAAIAPISGYGDPEWAPALSAIPCWCFHGADDTVIPVGRSKAMVDAVCSAGGEAKLTLYESCGHGAWTEAYKSTQFHTWLQSQRRR